MTKESVTNTLVELGMRLGFRVGTEIQASDQLGWMLCGLMTGSISGPRKEEKWFKVKTWRQPVLPVVGFEIEASAGAKPLKGSIANLNDLGAIMGVVIISEENIAKMRKKGTKWSNETDESIWMELLKKTTKWVYETRASH